MPFWVFAVTSRLSRMSCSMLGMDAEIGSIAVGKRADLLLLDSGLQVQGVIRDGKQVIDNRLN